MALDKNYLNFEFDDGHKDLIVKLSVRGFGGATFHPVLSYSLDEGTTWVPYTLGTEINLHYKDKIYWKSETTKFNDKADSGYYFYAVGNVSSYPFSLKAGGEVASIINWAPLSDYCLANVFGYFPIRNAPTMPSDNTAPKGCFYKMFENCPLLEKAPRLPATILGESCYAYMFHNCASLISTPPTLPASHIAKQAYYFMFYQCNALEEVPFTLLINSSEVEDYGFYGMFCESSNLKNAPRLPALKLGNYCYEHMFSGCPSLLEAPELPALDASIYGGDGLPQDCYRQMFVGCTSLTKTPVLNSVYVPYGGYRDMFSSCTNLQEITMTASGYVEGAEYIAQNVTGYGIFYKSPLVADSKYNRVKPSSFSLVNAKIIQVPLDTITNVGEYVKFTVIASDDDNTKFDSNLSNELIYYRES